MAGHGLCYMCRGMVFAGLQRRGVEEDESVEKKILESPTLLPLEELMDRYGDI